MRYLLAVVREGTITDAARALGVSPTTTTRRLKSLEAAAGTRLFEKLKHGVVLTPAGEEVLAVADAVGSATDELDARLQGLDTRIEGTLRVASTQTLFRHWLPDLHRFRTKYPDVTLELIASVDVVNLTRREADVALRLAVDAPGHLVGRKTAELVVAVYAAPELVARGTDYRALPWIAWDFSVGRFVDTWLEANAPGATIGLRVDRMPTMIEAAAAGLGAAMLPRFVADAHPGLVRVGDAEFRGRHIWVLTHPQLRTSARVRAFTEFIHGVIERDRALFEGTAELASQSTIK